jgi:branched-subunit amino acid aminotransferase/4-amino-4-deoxychorismate lyase
MRHKTVLEIASQHRVKTDIRPLPKSKFLKANKVFIYSAGGGAVLIVYMNSIIYPNPTYGPITQKLQITYLD